MKLVTLFLRYFLIFYRTQNNLLLYLIYSNAISVIYSDAHTVELQLRLFQCIKICQKNNVRLRSKVKFWPYIIFHFRYFHLFLIMYENE